MYARTAIKYSPTLDVTATVRKLILAYLAKELAHSTVELANQLAKKANVGSAGSTPYG